MCKRCSFASFRDNTTSDTETQLSTADSIGSTVWVRTHLDSQVHLSRKSKNKPTVGQRMFGTQLKKNLSFAECKAPSPSFSRLRPGRALSRLSSKTSDAMFQLHASCGTSYVLNNSTGASSTFTKEPFSVKHAAWKPHSNLDPTHGDREGKFEGRSKRSSIDPRRRRNFAGWKRRLCSTRFISPAQTTITPCLTQWRFVNE